MNRRCPIGSLSLHTMNAERTECIWCGPNKLAWKPGKWVPNPDGTTSAWSVIGGVVLNLHAGDWVEKEEK